MYRCMKMRLEHACVYSGESVEYTGMNPEAWVLILVLPLKTWVALAKPLSPWGLTFLIFKNVDNNGYPCNICKDWISEHL